MLICVVALALPAAALAAEPTPEQIAQAIRDLSNRNFQVREKATKFLWQAGEVAELPLQRAVQSGDPEVVRRARSILDRFDRGEHPDTPKDIVELLQQYRSGNQTARLAILEKLVEKGKHGFRSLRRMSRNRDFAADRPLILALLVKHAPRQVPRLIVAGDVPVAQEWLEFSLIAPGVAAHENYAALFYLRKELPRAIAFWKAEAQSPPRALALAHLLLAARKWNEARPLVEETKDIPLHDRLNIGAGEWTRISTVAAAKETSKLSVERQCLLLASYRLSGDTAKYDALLARVPLEGTHPVQSVRRYATTFTHLGDWAAAERVLKSADDPLLFELIAERRGEKAAFDWARRHKPERLEARLELNLAKTRHALLLGETALAVSLIEENRSQWNDPAQWPLARRWVMLLRSFGHSEQALDHAAAMLEVLRRNESDDGSAAFFESIFDADAAVAEAWWHYLRVAQGDDSAKTLRLVRQILNGDKMPRLADWARDLAGTWKTQANEDATQTPERRFRALIGPLAAAEALRRAGMDEQAEANYREAMQALPAEAALRYADFFLSKRRFADALQLLDTAWQSEPNEAMLLFLRGHAMSLAGQNAEGSRLQELSHWLLLANLASRWRFCEELRRRGFHADAEREVEIALAVGNGLDSYYDSFLALAAAGAESRGDFQQAGDHWTQALALELFVNQSMEPRLALARKAESARLVALLEKPQKDEFLKSYRAAMDAAPRADLAAAVIAAATKESKKDVIAASAPALRFLDQRCKDFPSSAWACNEYAWLAAHMKVELDAAAERAKKAVAAEPKNASYLDTLAEVHFRRGEREAAVARNQECLKLQPNREYFKRQRERFLNGAADSFPK